MVCVNNRRGRFPRRPIFAERRGRRLFADKREERILKRKGSATQILLRQEQAPALLPPSKKRKALAVQPIYQAWGYIIVETVSTKSLTLPTAFFIFFFVFELLVPIVAVALAITEPTAIATPRPLMMFSVFFFIFILLKNFCLHKFLVQYYCLQKKRS